MIPVEISTLFNEDFTQVSPEESGLTSIMTSNFEKLTKGAQEHQYSYELTTPNQIQLARDPYTKKIQKEYFIIMSLRILKSP